MKLKMICIIFSLAIIGAMWYYSPSRHDKLLPVVETVMPSREDVRDSVVTHGIVEADTKKNIRLIKTATIEKLYVSVGDFVDEGDLIMDICEKDTDVADFDNIASYFPQINDISDIKDFYIPASFEEPIALTPSVTAPISGIITDIKIKEGETALGQLPILTISDFSKLRVKASIPELYIGEIKLGQQAKITSQAVPGKSFTATVAQISPIATQKLCLTGTGETTVDVSLNISSTNSELKPGYSVNAKIYTKTHKKTLTLPYTCIFQEGTDEFVFVVKDNKLVKKTIKTGFELDNKVEITSGLTEKDMVVNNPSDTLSDSMIVKVVS